MESLTGAAVALREKVERQLGYPEEEDEVVRVAIATVVAIGFLAPLPLVLVVAAAGASPAPSAEAITDIPPEVLTTYRGATATRCPTLPWAVLAAIGKIESDHGRIGGGHLAPNGDVEPPIIGIALDGSNGTQRILDTDEGIHDGDTVFDRAVGPMQFIPTTWASSGVDASGDGIADPHNAIDAIHASAAYLCAAGASDPSRIREAVWAYNHSWEYVDKVMAQTGKYATGGIDGPVASATLIVMVLANPRLDIYAAGRVDIAEGRIDARVLLILQLASERHTLRVSSLKTGHSRCVGGGNYERCRVSNHWHGRAADISIVDGSSVNQGNSPAKDLARSLSMLPVELRPDDVGTPWPDLSDLEGYFSDADHDDHIHLGSDA